MTAQRKTEIVDPARHGLAIDELAKSIDQFRRTLSELRPSVLSDTVATGHEAIARRLYHARRERADAFPDSDDLFGEPAWDVMLDLFIAGESKRAITMSDAAAGACASAHAAQRWIAILEARGMVERYSDPQDRRRTLLRLSAATTDAMRRYLDGM